MTRRRSAREDFYTVVAHRLGLQGTSAVIAPGAGKYGSGGIVALPIMLGGLRRAERGRTCENTPPPLPPPIHEPRTTAFSYRKYWAHRFGLAPFLPMSRDEMDVLGWDSCDIILVTGDAYIDHPSFGMALVGRLPGSPGVSRGIISQPDWHSAAAFQRLGKPNLFFGVTAGNMDSMVNRYTSDRKIRSDDAYTPAPSPTGVPTGP